MAGFFRTGMAQICSKRLYSQFGRDGQTICSMCRSIRIGLDAGAFYNFEKFWSSGMAVRIFTRLSNIAVAGIAT
jgi:hypothetical protein